MPVETCATHGLRYDPALHDGCVLCRRLTEATAAPAELPEAAEGSRATRFAGLGAVAIVGGVLLWWLFGSPAGVNMSAAWSGRCPEACAGAAESCNAMCTDRGVISPCRDQCMGTFNDCLTGCSDAPPLPPGRLSFVYSVGTAPEWSEVEPALMQAMIDSSGCEPGRGPFAARLDVNPNGRLARASVAAPFRPTGECIQTVWLGRSPQLQAGEAYSLVVRGLPAPPPPAPPAARSAKPAPSAAAPAAAAAEDYLAQLYRMNPPGGAPPDPLPQPGVPSAGAVGAAAELVPVAGPVGAEPRRIARAAFEALKARCLSDGLVGTACNQAMRPLLDQLTAIPVNQRPGSSAVLAYEMNRAGLGFDCLWFSWPKFTDAQWRARPEHLRGSYPTGAYLVATPPGKAIGLVHDYFGPPRRLDVERAPWPASYETTFNHWGFYRNENNEARPFHEVCMSFPDDQRVTVYIGIGAWIDGPFAQREAKSPGDHMSHEEILGSLGLRGRILR